MGKSIKNIIFIIYIIVAVFTTVCLLSFNNYRVSEFGNSSLVIVDDKDLEPEFNKGDLLIVNKEDQIAEGDKAFFYEKEGNKIGIKLAEVTKAEIVTRTETTYTFEGEHKVSSEYVLGPAKTAEVLPKVGQVLGILESKWGFLFLIVLPALIAFLNQITVVYSDIKESREEGNDDEGEK